MRFSITIPAYKRKYLRECIDSVLAQTYTDFELVIVNDASPEGLDEEVATYHDARIRYYKNERNIGAVEVVDNWNRCLDYAQGEYVICMGDDDRLLPNCLQEYSILIDKYPGIGLLHGWTEIINEHSQVIELTAHRCEHESALSLCWHRWNAYLYQFIGDFCFERAWLKERGGFYKLPLAWGSDDITALIGAEKNGVVNTQAVVFQYRRNNQTISSTGNSDSKAEAIDKEERWYREVFLNTEAEEYTDQLYLRMLQQEIGKRYLKKKGGMMADDVTGSSLLRFFHWYRHRCRYDIAVKSFAYALVYLFRGR